MQWSGEAADKDGWTSKTQQKAYTAALKAAKKAEEAAEQAKVALKQAAVKGKGKGKGKAATGKGAGKGPEWWTCKDADCTRDLKKINRGPACNPKNAKQCWNCLGHKDMAEAVAKATRQTELAELRAKVAAKPPPAATQPCSQPAVAASSKEKAPSVGEKLAEALQATAEQLRNPVKPAKAPLAFTREHKESFQLLLPSLQPLLQLLQEDILPPPLELPSASDTVLKWMGDSRPCNRAKEKEELLTAVKRMKGAMAALEDSEAQHLQPSLAAKEAALAKLERDPSDLASQLAGVVAAAAKFRQGVSERLNRMQQAKARSEERQSKRKEFLDQLAEQIKAAQKSTAELEQQHAQLHERRAQEHLVREEEVRQQFEAELESLKGVMKAEEVAKEKEKHALEAKKRSEAKDAQTAVNSGTQSPQTASALTPSAPVDPAMAIQELQRQLMNQMAEAERKHALQMKELQDRIQQQASQIVQASEHAKQQAARQEIYEKYCPVDETKLPALRKPSGEQLGKQSQLLFLLRAWKGGGSSAPVIFQDLVDYSELGAEVPLFVRTALGSAWSVWFPNDPAATAVVPKQVLLLVLGSLEKLGDSLEADDAAEETEKAAAGTYAQMAGTTKKRRAEALDEAMGMTPA